MSNDIGFQIVCANCGCLSIRIEEPLQSSREEMVYCGDCGNSRGSIGALRDLAVHGHPGMVFPTSIILLPDGEPTPDELRPASEISLRYAELRRLRQQVKIAEWLAGESNRSTAFKHGRKKDARHLAYRPPLSGKDGPRAADKRESKRPS
jgi:hypothetical protein